MNLHTGIRIDMNFHEAFSNLSMKEDLDDAFSDVSVDGVEISRKAHKVTIVISSHKPVAPEFLARMRRTLRSQLFKGSSDVEIDFEEHYNMGDASLLDIYNSYKENIFTELDSKGHLYRLFLEDADIEFNGNVMHIDAENDFFTVARMSEISGILKKIFLDRFGVDADIRTTFHAVEHKKKKDVESVTLAEAEADALSERTRFEKSAKKTEGKEGVDYVKAPAPQKAAAKKSEKSEYRRPPKLPDDPDIFYGKPFAGRVTDLHDIIDEIGEVVVRGQVMTLDSRELKSGKTLLIFAITDFTDSITAKIFVKPEELAAVKEKLAPGSFIKLAGVARLDNFEKEIAITYITGIKTIEDFRVKRMDNAPKKRVELHLHTIMSEMDACVNTKPLLKQLAAWGHKAVAITDHGVVQSCTDAFHAKIDLAKVLPKDFKLIYGVEAYLVDDPNIVRYDRGQKLKDPAVVFDIETTGFGAESDRIIEIGAVKVLGGEIVDRFSTFVNPGIHIPERITELTSITDEMVRDADDISVVLPKFVEFCKDCFVVGHNSSFDTGFIAANMKRLGINGDFTIVDTMDMARVFIPGLKNYKLDTVADALKVSLGNHHRAVDDAECTAGIYLKLCDIAIEKLGTDELAALKECRFSTETIRNMRTYHCIILAKNDAGRSNLYKLISESHLTYFKRRPRIPKRLLSENREGLIVGSACCAGELFSAVLRENEAEMRRIAAFYDYLEIQPLANNKFMIESTDGDYSNVKSDDDLIKLNKRIVELGDELHKPVVATCDVHFLNPEDQIYRTMILNVKDMAGETPAPLYLRTTEEMLEEFSYLGEEKAMEVVVTNSNLIADMIENIDPVRPDKCPPKIENSDETLRTICYNRAHELYGEKLPEPVEARLEKELTSIISNGYSVLYIIAQKLVWKSNEDGYLVGSRGSVGSSFAAFMAGITEVNSLPAHYRCPKCFYTDFDSDEVKSYSGMSGCDMPDKTCPVCGEPLIKDGHDIPFETFLGFNGDKEPDIDLNFSGEYQSKAHAYTEVIFGEGQTFKAGTIGGVADKTAYGYVLKYNEGHGITNMRRAEITRISQGCIGVKRTTGQHPGGIVVLPIGEKIYTFTPVQHPANDMTSNIVTTHYDYHSIDHNLLKLDILGHDDPTMIRMLEDITGVDATTIRMDDPGVLALFHGLDSLGLKPSDLDGVDLGTLGVPEFGTKFVMQMLHDTKPTTFSELVRISGLSHGTNVWLDNAQTLINEGKCTLKTAICTRDDIMIYLIQKGLDKGHAFKIMERVRKGKGLPDEWMEPEMKEHGVPDWYIWSCKRIKYMFPKAHAVAYVTMGLRIAYYKVHYPLAYYAAFFSIRAKAFSYELMCQGQTKLLENLKAIRDKGKDMSPKDQDLLGDGALVQEMYARGFSFMPIDLYRAKARRFQIIDGKLMPSFASIEGLGDTAAVAIEEAVKRGERFLSRDDLKKKTGLSQTNIDKMGELGILDSLPKTNQISLMDYLNLT